MLVSRPSAADPLIFGTASNLYGAAPPQLLDSPNAMVVKSGNRAAAFDPISDMAVAARQTTIARQGTVPRSTLILGLIISALLHGVVIGFGGIAPQRPGTSGKPSLELSFRPAAPIATREQAVDAAIASEATLPKPRGRASAAVPVASAAPAQFDKDSTVLQRAPRDDEKLDLARFDPVLYLTPSEVQRVALPINQELFDFLPLTGFQPGLWLVRLFIDEEGRVNEVEFVESRGTERNTEELRAILLANRFMPGLREDGPVKSQKMIEVSFEPGPEPRLSTPVLIPSAAEK